MRIKIFGRKERKDASAQPVNAVTRTTLGELIAHAKDDGVLSSYSMQVRDGLSKNPYVNRCVDLRSTAVAALTPVLLGNDGKPMENPNHPLSIFFRKPHPTKSWRDLVYEAQTHLALNGNAYLWCIKTVKGLTEVHVIDPAHVTPQPSCDVLDPIAYYMVDAGSRGQIVVEPRNMIHLHTALDTDGLRGVSPLESISLSVLSQTEARNWNRSLMQNGAAPSMYISIPRELDKNTFARFKEKIVDQYAGSGNAGKVAVFDGGTTASSLNAFSAKDMDFTEGLMVTAKEIAIAFGMPLPLIGDATTYSNLETATKDLALHTIIPLADQLYEQISLKICGMYGDVSSVTYDKAEVEGLKGDQSALIASLTGCTFLTTNEKREMLGYNEVGEDGNVILVPMGNVPLKESAGDVDMLIGGDDAVHRDEDEGSKDE